MSGGFDTLSVSGVAVSGVVSSVVGMGEGSSVGSNVAVEMTIKGVAVADGEAGTGDDGGAVRAGDGEGVATHGPSAGYCGRPGIRLTIRLSYCGVSDRLIVTVRHPPGRLSQIWIGVSSGPPPLGCSETVCEDEGEFVGPGVGVFDGDALEVVGDGDDAGIGVGAGVLVEGMVVAGAVELGAGEVGVFVAAPAGVVGVRLAGMGVGVGVAGDAVGVRLGVGSGVALGGCGHTCPSWSS
jgi:hypothetical protein